MLGYSIFSKRARAASKILAMLLVGLCSSPASASQTPQAEDKPTVSSVLARAETIAKSMTSADGYNSDKANALLTVAIGKAKSGDLEAALHMLNALEKVAGRNDDAAVSVATEQANTGDIAGACHTIRSHIRLEFRDVWLLHIAETLSARSDWLHARAIATKIGYPIFRSDALNATSIARAKLGDYGGAEEILATIPRRSERADALANLAKHLYQHGDRPKASLMLQRALKAAVEARKDLRKGWAFRSVSKAMYDTGDKTGAKAALNQGLNAVLRINSREARDNGIYHIAVARADIGDYKRALDIVGARLTGDQKNSAYAAIATLAAVAKNEIAANNALISIQNKKARDKSLWYVALGQADARQFDNAVKTAGEIHDTNDRYSAFENIAKDQARAGDISGAEESIAKVKDIIWRVSALQAIGNARAKTGDVEGAITYAMEAKKSLERLYALVGVAEGMIESSKKSVKSLAKR
jgi:tetratricopeptide (TPR) repeat protein